MGNESYSNKFNKNGTKSNVETETLLNNNKEEGIEMMEIYMKDDIETLAENAVEAKYGVFSPIKVIGDGKKVKFVDISNGKVVSEYESNSDLVGFRNISNAISDHLEKNHIPSKIYKVGESVQGVTQSYEGGQVVINDNGINVLMAMPNITAKERRSFKHGLIKANVETFGGRLPILSFRTDDIFSFDTGIMLESVYGENTINKDFNTAEDALEQKRIALLENLKSRKITFYFSDSAKNEIVAVRRGMFSQEYIEKIDLATNQQDEYGQLMIELLNYQANINPMVVLRSRGEYL